MRVVLAEDLFLLRDGLVRLLEAYGHSVIAAVETGPDAHDVIARVRQYLADDLDTPKALAALDGWTTDALEYGGHDAEAPRAVATLVDALLGVELSSPQR